MKLKCCSFVMVASNWRIQIDLALSIELPDLDLGNDLHPLNLCTCMTGKVR